MTDTSFRGRVFAGNREDLVFLEKDPNGKKYRSDLHFYFRLFKFKTHREQIAKRRFNVPILRCKEHLKILITKFG